MGHCLRKIQENYQYNLEEQSPFHKFEGANLFYFPFIFQLFDAVKKGVLHSLQHPPPDIEALRVYLLLPECSVYRREEHYDAIIIPFSEVILRLSAEAGKVLSKFNHIYQEVGS